MKNEIYLSFNVIGDDMKHDEITQTLNIAPTKIYVKGEERRKGSGLVWPGNKWLFDASQDTSLQFEEQIEILMNIIESNYDAFKTVCQDHEGYISLAMYMHPDESTPSVHLDQRHIKIMQDLNLEFDVDLYILPKDDSEEGWLEEWRKTFGIYLLSCLYGSVYAYQMDEVYLVHRFIYNEENVQQVTDLVKAGVYDKALDTGLLPEGYRDPAIRVAWALIILADERRFLAIAYNEIANRPVRLDLKRWEQLDDSFDISNFPKRKLVYPF